MSPSSWTKDRSLILPVLFPFSSRMSKNSKGFPSSTATVKSPSSYTNFKEKMGFFLAYSVKINGHLPIDQDLVSFLFLPIQELLRHIL